MAGVAKFLEKKTRHEVPMAPGATCWRMEIDAEGICWLWLDCPDSSVNVISETVLRELGELIETVKERRPKALAIRSAKPAGFAAGADIESFAELAASGAEEQLRKGHEVFDRLEALSIPTVAVVHGAALGGGFELALACDHRVALEGASFGFPEVQLGLHPGLGGTFRLTELIDPVRAMTLMLTGSTAHTSKARKLGIADTVVPERHVVAAVLAASRGELKRKDQGMMASAFRMKTARSLATPKMRSETQKKAPREHYPAPYALIDLWEDHGSDRAAMQEAEITSFAKLLESSTAQNLIRVFFLRQKLRREARGDDGIHHVHVVGAGAMGGEIAAQAAMKGKVVTIGDVKAEPLGTAIKVAAKVFEKKHLSGIEARDAMDRLIPDMAGLGIPKADLIIEAAPENPELKEKIYRDLGAKMKPGAILATNTSSLKLSELVNGAPHPERFAGLHFFNPVSSMPLVEVVAHDSAAPETLGRLSAFCGTIGKLPARVGDYPGFLVNRVLTPYLLEAMLLLDEGVDKEVIDRAAVDFGMPMGPVTLADQVGLDICLHVGESLRTNLDKPMAQTPEWVKRKVEEGKLGKKTGEGFYDWSKGTPQPQSDASGPDDLTDRLILPMLDAAVECLRMGVVPDRETVDAAVIFGTGFAPFRGGPMHYADIRGRDNVRKRLQELEARHGERFAPDPGWDDLG